MSLCLVAFSAIFALASIGSAWAEEPNGHLQSAPMTCEVKNRDLAGHYEGDCKNGLADGKGVARGKDTYEGEFHNGTVEGRGVYTWANGNRYEGTFLNNQRSGKGVMTWAEGDRYDGEYLYGKMDGTGTFIARTGVRYQGQFSNGQRHGSIAMITTDGRRIPMYFLRDQVVTKEHYLSYRTATDSSFARELEQYRLAAKNAVAIKDLDAFIEKYRDADPDRLVPQALYKLEVAKRETKKEQFFENYGKIHMDAEAANNPTARLRGVVTLFSMSPPNNPYDKKATNERLNFVLELIKLGGRIEASMYVLPMTRDLVEFKSMYPDQVQAFFNAGLAEQLEPSLKMIETDIQKQYSQMRNAGWTIERVANEIRNPFQQQVLQSVERKHFQTADVLMNGGAKLSNTIVLFFTGE